MVVSQSFTDNMSQIHAGSITGLDYGMQGRTG